MKIANHASAGWPMSLVRKSRTMGLAGTLTPTGANDLALELLLALQATPLARILPSRRGRGTLMGDISYLVTQIDVSEFDLRSFIPLFVHVDSHASDQKICEALFTIL